MVLCVFGGLEGFLERGQNIGWKMDDEINCWVVEVMDRLCILIKFGNLNCLLLDCCCRWMRCEPSYIPSWRRCEALSRTSLICIVHGE